VKKPAMMAFHGSSFFRTPFTAQSNVLNMPPQTPKLPPRTGARALIAVRAVVVSSSVCCSPRMMRCFCDQRIPPIRRSPYGLFLNPFTPCHTAPPIACPNCQLIHAHLSIACWFFYALPYKRHHRNPTAQPMGMGRESGPVRGLVPPSRELCIKCCRSGRGIIVGVGGRIESDRSRSRVRSEVDEVVVGWWLMEMFPFSLAMREN
jgi:hypothetical protein